MKKRILMKKLALAFSFILFCVSIFSALPVTASETEDLTLGGLVPEKTIEEMGHKQISDNLTDQLNGVEYINEDGTATAYLFAEPIKYEDENNQIKWIDKSLRKAVLKNGWKSTANWFSFFVHNDIQDGVELSYDDVSLTAVPVLDGPNTIGKQKMVSRIDDLRVAMAENQTEIAYESTYTGYNMNITVPVGDGTLFAMDIAGDISSVTEENGQVTVAMKDGSAVIYTIQAAFTDEQYLWSEDIEITVIRAKKDTTRIEYSVSENVTADIISIQIGNEVISATDNNDRSSSASVSVTRMVYSYFPNRYYGFGNYYLIGSQGENKNYRSFVYMDVSQLSSIPYNRILGANYHVYEQTNEDTSFQAEAYMVTESWTETATTWSNMPSHDEEKITTVNVSHFEDQTWYDFYITRAVMAWLQGIPNYGIMLKSRTENIINYRQFAGHQNSSYVPNLSVTYTTETTSMDNIGIEDGEEYYIKNKNSMKYLTASGNTGSSNVMQSDWTGADNQKWTVDYQGNGYYKLTPSNATNMVLDTSGGSNTNGANIQLYSPNNGLGQEFKFIRNWDGSYQIVTHLSNDVRGLKVENNSESGGGNVYQWSHTVDWMMSDDWTLETVENGFASLYCFTEEEGDGYGLNTYQYSEDVLSSLIDMDYAVCLFVDEPASTAYNLMPDDSLFVFIGHGTSEGLHFKSDGNYLTVDRVTASTPYANSIYDMSHNALAKLQLATYASCYSGKDDSITDTNLAGVTYQRGAHVVTSHPVAVTSGGMGDWVIVFLAACAEGKTVYQAMNAADEYLYNETNDYIYGNANQRHVLGDFSMQLYHSEEEE